MATFAWISLWNSVDKGFLGLYHHLTPFLIPVLLQELILNICAPNPISASVSELLEKPNLQLYLPIYMYGKHVMHNLYDI